MQNVKRMNEIFRSIELFLIYPVILLFFHYFVVFISNKEPSAAVVGTSRQHETQKSQKDAVNVDHRDSIIINNCDDNQYTS
jgi:hypothetical protein